MAQAFARLIREGLSGPPRRAPQTRSAPSEIFWGLGAASGAGSNYRLRSVQNAFAQLMFGIPDCHAVPTLCSRTAHADAQVSNPRRSLKVRRVCSLTSGWPGRPWLGLWFASRSVEVDTAPAYPVWIGEPIEVEV